MIYLKSGFTLNSKKIIILNCKATSISSLCKLFRQWVAISGASSVPYRCRHRLKPASHPKFRPSEYVDTWAQLVTWERLAWFARRRGFESRWVENFGSILNSHDTNLIKKKKTWKLSQTLTQYTKSTVYFIFGCRWRNRIIELYNIRSFLVTAHCTPYYEFLIVFENYFYLQHL